MRILQYQAIDLTNKEVFADCFSTLTDLDVYMQKEFPSVKQYGIQKYYITDCDDIYTKEIYLNSKILN